MKVAALGRTKWLYDSILLALSKGHQIVLIGTSPAAPEYSLNEDDFAQLAEKIGCLFFCDPAINQSKYIQLINSSHADVAISVNWLNIIGKDVIDLFEHGIINAHAGDLPRFKGNATSNWAILSGESKVVLSLHKMVPDLDAGPILLKREYPITSETYISDIYNFFSENIPIMFGEALESLSTGRIKERAQPQDLMQSLRCFPRIPQDGCIDWSNSAEDIARLVRASGEPFGGAYTFLGQERLTIWRARPDVLPYPYLGIPGHVAEIRRERGEVVVLTGNGVLVLEEVETASKGRKRASQLINSIRIRLGMNLQDEVVRLRNEIERLKQVNRI